MCSSWQTAPAAEVARELAAGHRELLGYYPTHFEDARVAQLARATLLQQNSITSTDDVSIAFRDYQQYDRSAIPHGDEGDVVLVKMYRQPHGENVHDAVMAAETTERYVLALTPRGQLVFIRPLANDDALLRYTYEFARAVASYILLNDLMASDAVVPREGCSLALRFQLGSAPEVLQSVESNLNSPPASDVTVTAAIQIAYNEVAIATASRNTAPDRLTKQTLTDLGKNPAITLIYRDDDSPLGSGTQYVVARLQNGNSRAYVDVKISAGGVAEIDVLPLCLVGDTRCAQYYLWP